MKVAAWLWRSFFSYFDCFYRCVSLCILVALSWTLASCSPAADVKLRGPEKPKPPVGEVTTPSENPTPTPTPGAFPAPTPGPDSPDNSNAETPIPLQRSYRLFCHDRYPSYLTVVSSKASATGFGSDLDVQVYPESQPLPVTGGFSSGDRNLEYHMFPQPIEIDRDPARGLRTRFVYSARPLEQVVSTSDSRNIYLSEVFLAERIGRANLLGPEMSASASVEVLADAEGVDAKTFGVSDGGKFILVLSKSGLSLYDSKTFRGLGKVIWKLASGRKLEDYFAPTLREADLALSVSHVDSALSVSTEVYQLSFDIRGEFELGAKILEVSNLRRPLISLSSSLGTPDRLLYGLSGGKTSPASAEIVVAEPAKLIGSRVTDPAVITKFRVEKLPQKGRVPSALVVWKETSGEWLSLLAVEEFTPSSGGTLGSRYKVQEASFHTLVLNKSLGLASPLSPTSRLPYPQQVRADIEAGSVSSRVAGLKDLQFSPDRKSIFALLPGSLSHQIYRLNSIGLDRVSQKDCSSLSIGVEP